MSRCGESGSPSTNTELTAPTNGATRNRRSFAQHRYDGQEPEIRPIHVGQLRHGRRTHHIPGARGGPRSPPGRRRSLASRSVMRSTSRTPRSWLTRGFGRTFQRRRGRRTSARSATSSRAAVGAARRPTRRRRARRPTRAASRRVHGARSGWPSSAVCAPDTTSRSTETHTRFGASPCTMALAAPASCAAARSVALAAPVVRGDMRTRAWLTAPYSMLTTNCPLRATQ